MQAEMTNAMMFRSQRLDGTEFERFADDYGSVRPGYPPEGIEDVIRECGLAPASRVLEIGMGTGIATADLLRSGASFVGIEPGQNLLRIAKERLGPDARVEYFGSPFEDFKSEETFDAVVSATAFHWLKESDKFERVASLLKPGGKLAIFWNSFCRSGDAANAEVEDAYRRLLPGTYGPEADVNGKVLAKADGKVREILDSRTFTLGFLRRYVRRHEYGAERYVSLLRTYPKIIQAEEPVREEFLKEISSIVARHGQMVVPVMTTVCIAQRTSDFSSFVSSSM